jgi:HSP20 family molecular chaperone IbpA
MDIWFPTYQNGMMYKEETNESFIYYKGIPGLTKEDLDIREFIEEDFITILVKSKKSSIFVENLYFKIVKTIDKVNIDKEVKASVEKGVLTIEIPKAFVIKEITL